MGKGVVDESHPQFIGLYEGKRSRPYVVDRVENSNCIIELGFWDTDFNTGGFSVRLPHKKVICSVYNRTFIKNHVYEEVTLKDFINGLAGNNIY